MKDLHKLFMDPLPERREWIENGILPKGALFVFGGGTAIGKTFIILNLLRQLVEGTTFLNTEWRVMDKPKSILYLDAEIGEDLLAQRVKQVFEGCTALKPKIIMADCATATCKLDVNEGRQELFKKIRACPVVPDIIVIDPLSYFLEQDDSDNLVATHVYNTCRMAQEQFNKDLTFIISHHYRKKPSGRGMETYDPLDLTEFRGASQWANISWTMMTLNRTHDNNDGGWVLEARFPKIRANKPISGTYYFVMKDERMTLWPKGVAKVKNPTWG